MVRFFIAHPPCCASTNGFDFNYAQFAKHSPFTFPEVAWLSSRKFARSTIRAGLAISTMVFYTRAIKKLSILGGLLIAFPSLLFYN
jgi:hypothetical protein